jgi:TolB-like protein
MSPEQARGTEVDARSDIFSLGSVIYEMVTGKAAFEGETASDVIANILKSDPMSPAMFTGEVPDEIERIIGKALCKDRESRYQTVQELYVDLQAFKKEAEFRAKLGEDVAPRLADESRPKALVPALSIDGRAKAKATDPSSGGFRAVLAVADKGLSGRKPWIIAALVLLMAAVAGAFLYWRRTRFTAPPIESIAVLPFANVDGSADTDYLSDGLAQSLVESLARVPNLQVKSRDSLFRYKDKAFDAQKVGSELTVDALLRGRVAQSGDRIEVTAELTSVPDNTTIWSERYERQASDIMLLQEQIAGDIAENLRSKLSGTEKRRVTAQGTHNPEAYKLYAKGRFLWNKRTGADIKTAISYFNQALEKDPSYALAYAGLADAYSVLSVYGGDPSDVIPKSNAAAAKALQLDPTLARPHAVLGYNKMLYSWDFPGGEAEFRKAFALDPGDATAHQWFAEALAYIGGRSEESIVEANWARELDPLSPIIGTALAEVFYFDRQYEKAIRVCNKVIAANPDFGSVHNWLAFSYWAEHEYPQAIHEWSIAAHLEGDKNYAQYTAALERGFASGGWKGAVREGIEVSLALREAKAVYVSPYGIAQLYAALGDETRAFEWLNTAYREHDYWLVTLPTDPWLDSLRSTARYSEMARTIGFRLSLR